MSEDEFIINLKQLLESDYFSRIIKEKEQISSEAKRKFITKAFNYLITTRDFTGFEKYIDRYYKENFPYKYLYHEKGLSTEEIKRLTHDNFIKNGFLFHITPSHNLESIHKDGLLTLNDKYQCDLYQKCLELEKIYQNIRTRNINKYPELLRTSSLIRIPGFSSLEERRFNTVYLSSNLDYITKTYGEFGEFSTFFVRDIFSNLNLREEIDYFSKEELKLKLINLLCNSNLKIKDKEIEKILDFYNLIAEDNKKNKDSYQSLLMIPTTKINNNSSMFKNLYQTNKLGVNIDFIIEYGKGEVENFGSIKPENIITITQEKDKTLSLSMNRQNKKTIE